MKTKEAIRVGDIICPPGERRCGKLLVGYERDSAELNLWTVLLNGVHEGPTLYLGCLIHGPEVVGVEVIRRITREIIDPQQLSGAIIAIPVQNPLAFRTSTYHSLEDGLNANRIFPGDPEETLTNRIVSRIYQDALVQSDYAIDFHANARGSVHFNFVRWNEEPVAKESLEMSQAYGVSTILSVAKTFGYGFEERLVGLLADAAMAKGIPTLTVELTPWYDWDENSIRSGVRGTLNVMKHLGMIDGNLEPQTDVPFISEVLGPMLRVTANKGGFVWPITSQGEWVSKNEVVALVRNPWGDVVEEIQAPADGYVLAFPRHGTHAVASGDIVVFVAPVSDQV